jgi:hypothetical protein
MLSTAYAWSLKLVLRSERTNSLLLDSGFSIASKIEIHLPPIFQNSISVNLEEFESHAFLQE